MGWAERQLARQAAQGMASRFSTESGRRLDPSEAYFHLMEYVARMHFLVLVERTEPWDAAHLRVALDHIQETDALLRQSIVPAADGHALCFAEVTNKPIPLEMVDLDTDVWTPWVEAELNRPFLNGEGPLVRCAQLTARSNRRACLVLSLHHAITDGRAAATLVKRLVDFMAGLRKGEGGIALEPPVPVQPPAMHSIFPAAFRWEANPGALRKMASTLLREAAATGYPDPLPWIRPERDMRRQPRHRRFRLEEADFARLRHQIKTESASLYGALCAAQLLAQYRLLNTRDTVRLFLTTPVDLRQQLDSLVGTSPTQLYAANLYSIYAVNATTSFWQLARDIMDRTKMQMERGDAHYFYSAREVTAAMRLPSDAESIQRLNAHVPLGTVMSVMGRIPPMNSDPAVESLSYAGCYARHQLIFSGATTYRNVFFVDVCFDDGNLLDGIGDALTMGLHEEILRAIRL